MQRPRLLLGLALLASGCNREPDFDARYEAAEKTIREKAAAMDRELQRKAASKPATPQPLDPGDKQGQDSPE